MKGDSGRHNKDHVREAKREGGQQVGLLPQEHPYHAPLDVTLDSHKNNLNCFGQKENENERSDVE